MAIGQMLDGSGNRNMLASQCKCTQCGHDLSAMSYERRVAHIKRCAANAKQRADSASQNHGSRTAGSADMQSFSGRNPASGADSGHINSSAASIDISHGVEGILKGLGLDAHIPAFHKDEVDIRALPALTDDDFVYLGISDAQHRHKLLRIARALKKSNAQQTMGSAQAFQQLEAPSSSADTRGVAMPQNSPANSHDRGSGPHLISDQPAAEIVQETSSIGKLKPVAKQTPQMRGDYKRSTAVLQPAGNSLTGQSTVRAEQSTAAKDMPKKVSVQVCSATAAAVTSKRTSTPAPSGQDNAPSARGLQPDVSRALSGESEKDHSNAAAKQATRLAGSGAKPGPVMHLGVHLGSSSWGNSRQGLQPHQIAADAKDAELQSSAARRFQAFARRKRIAGDAFAVMPHSCNDSDFAEQPKQDNLARARFAKLGNAALSSRKHDRPSAKAGSKHSSGTTGKHPLSTGLGPKQAPSVHHTAEFSASMKSEACLTAQQANKPELKTNISTLNWLQQQGPLGTSSSEEHLRGPQDKAAAVHKGQGQAKGQQGALQSLEPCQPMQGSSNTKAAACSEELPEVSRSEQAACPEGKPDSGGPGKSVKEESPTNGDAKPDGYLSGALGHLLAARSVRACISQNGSYSRQAELRLLQALYPDEREQCCSSSKDGDRHCQSSHRGDRDAWSSDDEGTAAKENDPVPHVSCAISCPGVQQVPNEASLWAMSHQDPQRHYPVQSLRQRQAARKAAKFCAPPAQQPNQIWDPLQAARSGTLPAQQPWKSLQPPCSAITEQEVSATSTAAPEQPSAVAGSSKIRETDGEVQLRFNDSASRFIARGTNAVGAAANAIHQDSGDAGKQTGVAGKVETSNKALRVEALRQELIAAEAVVSELKAWLADAEAELATEKD